MALELMRNDPEARDLHKIHVSAWILVQKCSRNILTRKQVSDLEKLPGWTWKLTEDEKWIFDSVWITEEVYEDRDSGRPICDDHDSGHYASLKGEGRIQWAMDRGYDRLPVVLSEYVPRPSENKKNVYLKKKLQPFRDDVWEDDSEGEKLHWEYACMTCKNTYINIDTFFSCTVCNKHCWNVTLIKNAE